MRRSYGAGILVAAAFAMACADSPTGPGTSAPPIRANAGGFTPLQESVAQAIATRGGRGLPTPTLSFEFESEQGSSLFDLEQKRLGPGEKYSFTAKTVIRYAGPNQAGLKEWPAFALDPEQSRKLGISSAQLRERYKSRMERADHGIWQRYELGHEPRTYTITETGTTTYPLREAARATLSRSTIGATSLATASEDLVFGFSLTLPRDERSTSFGIDDIQELKFTVIMDWGVGMRLPVAATLDAMEPMKEGSTYFPTSFVNGLNFSAARYAAVGLPPEAGHEIYFRAQAQGCLEFRGIIDSGRQCAGPDIDAHSDFTTPFGPNTTVPFPTYEDAMLDYGIAGIDLVVNSRFGSNQITGDWAVIGAARGNGTLEYRGPSSSETLSSVHAVDGPGVALFGVDGFLYHFTHFTVSPAVKVWVDVHVPIPLAPDIDWEDSRTLHLGTYDLSDFIDRDFLGSDGASVGVDHNPGYTGPIQVRLDVPVLNVAPTATLSHVGGAVTIIGGVPTVIGNTGELFSFTGRSHDPGRDDLTLSWSWGNGPPVPDESTLYPLDAPNGPNDASDTRVHVFDRACIYDVTFKSVDDDGDSGEDHASILVTQTGGDRRSDGYWQHQLRGNGSVLDPAVVDCYLAIVARVSSVFSEKRSVATAASAFDVVNLAQNGGSEIEKLDRELLVAWLNFASGSIGYSQSVDTNTDGVPDAPFNEVMRAAETLRGDPSASSKALKGMTQLIHSVWSGK